MTSKQRAKLRAMANDLQPVIYIGKEGITQPLITDANGVLTKRELVKGSVGKNCEMDVRTVVNMLAEELGAAPISTVGRKFVLYKRNEEKPVIEI